MRHVFIHKAAIFELEKSQLLACPTLYYGMIFSFRKYFPVLERPFLILEQPRYSDLEHPQNVKKRIQKVNRGN